LQGQAESELSRKILNSDSDLDSDLPYLDCN
jgi:hypothetical protein